MTQDQQLELSPTMTSEVVTRDDAFDNLHVLSTNPDSVMLICLFLTTVVNLPLALFSFAAASSSIADAKRTLTQ